MIKRKTFYDDGFQEHLVEGANFLGEEGIPELLNIQNTEQPRALIPFTKLRTSQTKRGYVHFYTHDKYFKQIFGSTDKYVELLKQFDGVISPDPTIIVGKSKCLHAVSTYMNRAIGYYFQKQGIPVIPNVRWGDESTYSFAFLGVPKKSIVAISTHGCIKRDSENSNFLRDCFKKGLTEMLRQLEPRMVIVHGFMPDEIFKQHMDKTNFVRYPSEFEESRKKGGLEYGIVL